MNPTTIVSPPVTAVSLRPLGLVTSTSSGSIVLTEAQLEKAQHMLSTLDFATIPVAEITTLGHASELSLTQNLDGFLANIDKAKNPKLFELFGRLHEGVSDAKLPDLITEIKSNKIGLTDRVLGLFNKKRLANASQEAYQATCDLIAGRTKNLATVMHSLEKDLGVAMHDLMKELSDLEVLKKTYRGHIDDFAVVAAVAHGFLQQARGEVEAQRQLQLSSPDMLGQSDLQESEAKLQLLESRALALEGVYSRLPADQLVIQQVQAAGIQTLQETATTATSRFNSIKTTLISLNGALKVKGVQQMAAQHADMDRQLATIRGQIMKEVVTSAANAPGDNRLAQANQLQELVTMTGEVHELVVKARAENAKKFDAARSIFTSARNSLATLSSQTQSAS